jgi:hypothetical protein
VGPDSRLAELVIAFIVDALETGRVLRERRDRPTAGRRRDRVAANGIAGLAMAGAMTMAVMRSSGLVGHSSGVMLASTAPIGHLRRVNLIERQRDQRESEAVSCARAPQRPVPAASSLLPFATHPAAATRNREPSCSTASVGGPTASRAVHRYRPGSAGRDLSPATGEKDGPSGAIPCYSLGPRTAHVEKTELDRAVSQPSQLQRLPCWRPRPERTVAVTVSAPHLHAHEGGPLRLHPRLRPVR